jgi:hypothetical protein
VTAFTDKEDLKAYLKRTRGTFNRPLVYRIDDGETPRLAVMYNNESRWIVPGTVSTDDDYEQLG